jgi:DNA polymerase-3 subunit delta'
MDRILGQNRALDLLYGTLRSGRVPHAFIFHGPPGVGKWTTARAFARLLLCHQPNLAAQPTPAVCGHCPSCQKFIPPDRVPSDAGEAEHPDLHFVNKELARYSSDSTIRGRKQTSSPVEVLREFLLEPVYQTAHFAKGKVFILDEAELLNLTGQNLLLKTLEEPPADTKLILVTASEDRLLPTIRSRCQRVAFLPLGDTIVEHWLAQQAQERALTTAQRDWLIGFAAGSLGRAQMALQYNLTAWATLVLPALEEMEKKQLPAGLGKAMEDLIKEFAEQRVKESPKVDGEFVASKEAANKLATHLMFLLITQHARRRLAHGCGKTAEVFERVVAEYFPREAEACP